MSATDEDARPGSGDHGTTPAVITVKADVVLTGQAQADPKPPAQDPETVALDSADRDAELADIAAMADAYRTLAVGEVERGRDGAKTVQTASAALAALYTGILGFTFSVADNPLPARGVLTPVFLGVAVVLSTFYLAWMSPEVRRTPSAVAEEKSLEQRVVLRAGWIGEIAQSMTRRNAWALRGGVVALGVGLVYVALPFVSLGGSVQPGDAAAWPPAVVADGEDVSLAKLQYAARLEEFVAARQSTVVQNAAAEWWTVGIAGTVGAGLVLVACRLQRRTE